MIMSTNIFFMNQMLPQFKMFDINHIEVSISDLIKEHHNNFVKLEATISNTYEKICCFFEEK